LSHSQHGGKRGLANASFSLANRIRPGVCWHLVQISKPSNVLATAFTQFAKSAEPFVRLLLATFRRRNTLACEVARSASR
jgi:hypothetical protein